MIVAIFEVTPADGKRDAYLGIAANLRPLLDGIDGFLSIERFQSLSDPDRVLSLSFWRDVEAVKAWRNTEEHRLAQRPAATAFSKIIGCASPMSCATTACPNGRRFRRTVCRCMVRVKSVR